MPFNFFYTSNVSLPRELLLEAGLFDTSFPHAAWEDIEVAYRLMQRGMRMLYRPEAVARHHHDITFASFRRRQEKAGEAAAIFYRKHPELGRLPGRAPGQAPARAAGLSPSDCFPCWAARAERASASRAHAGRSSGCSATTTSEASSAASRRREPPRHSPRDDALTCAEVNRASVLSR